MNNSKNPTKVITGRCVASYLNVNEPKSINGSTPKYSVSLIIPKTDTETIAKIQAAIEAAYVEGESKLKDKSGKVPPLSSIKSPLRDGDVEKPDDAAYANSYFVNASSREKPGVVDANLQPIISSSELYSGIIVRASLNFYAYNATMNKGITAGLNNLQKISDGKPLGSRPSAASDFGGGTSDTGFLD